MDNKIILSSLREILHEMCIGCGGCKIKCENYQVIEYLIKEYESRQ